jgi:hypothetical protein
VENSVHISLANPETMLFQQLKQSAQLLLHFCKRFEIKQLNKWRLGGCGCTKNGMN